MSNNEFILVTSSDDSDSPDETIRRPGERGKSAVKDAVEDDSTTEGHSPVEGYEPLASSSLVQSSNILIQISTESVEFEQFGFGF